MSGRGSPSSSTVVWTPQVTVTCRSLDPLAAPEGYENNSHVDPMDERPLVREQIFGHQQPGGRLPFFIELLASGADLDLVDYKGRNAEAIARTLLSREMYTGEGVPEHPVRCRRPGAVEAFLALLADVRAAGSWKRYANAPRIDVIVLQRLCAAGRASPPPALARLFPTSTKSPPLPKELVWLILKFWRTDRDP